MWRAALEAAGRAGLARRWRPTCPGSATPPRTRPGTWERHVEHVERLRAGLGLDEVVLVVHDWGALIGLRWACEHPGRVRALVISASGFFPDGKWHGMARGLRDEGTGEELVEGMTRAELRRADGMGEPRHGRARRSTSTGSASATTSGAAASWSSTARATSRRSRATTASSPRWACRPCCCGASDDQFAPLAGGHRLRARDPRRRAGRCSRARATSSGRTSRERCAGELARFLRALH